MSTPPQARLRTPTGDITIIRLTSLAQWQDRLAELDPIFFEASLTKIFENDDVRSAFRARWFGRFLDLWPELAYVAIGVDGKLIGYIVGSHADPARDGRFSDIGYYRQLADLTQRYPAHLHINLASDARNHGVGSSLVAAFARDAHEAGLGGVHLVTGRDSRNRSFYARNGFDVLAELDWGGTPIVMLGKGL